MAGLAWGRVEAVGAPPCRYTLLSHRAGAREPGRKRRSWSPEPRAEARRCEASSILLEEERESGAARPGLVSHAVLPVLRAAGHGRELTPRGAPRGRAGGASGGPHVPGF